MTLSQKLIIRYSELKQQAPDCILLMQVGAFMQVMNDDAQTVSKVCHIKLQMAGEPEQPVVFGGFPKSALNKYVGQLVRASYSVAIAMQDDAKERHIEEIIRVQIEKPSS
jgi:DNA mismatch repair ATPase MutS